jgi:CDP-2,3-bis-(O-geranylgeranyl)-sn-glycerol synthase
MFTQFTISNLQSSICNLQFIISCLYFFLPAYFANMTPPIAKRLGALKSLAKPIDFEKKFFGKPIFGSHKTWRGAILAFLVGFSTALIQRLLFDLEFFKKLSIIDYSKINIFFFAFLISFGEIFGDLIFAFIKRRIGLKPGAPFLPFDQTNYVFGCFLLLQPYLNLDLKIWLTILILTFFLHIIFNRLGYHLKIHEAKW